MLYVVSLELADALCHYFLPKNATLALLHYATLLVCHCHFVSATAKLVTNSVVQAALPQMDSQFELLSARVVELEGKANVSAAGA
jgi:hypothetical protein